MEPSEGTPRESAAAPGETPAQPAWREETDPESRWVAFLAVIIVIVGQWWLARSLGLPETLVWLFPILAGALLAASMVLELLPGERTFERTLHGLAIALIAALVIATAVYLVALVRDVFFHGRIAPSELLVTGMALWLVNVAVFALIYWELDGGGPEARAGGYAGHPDFVFPQQMNPPELAAPGWKPRLADYLYCSLTNATAFSPTDTMPYSRWAKFAMGVQATLSLLIAVVIIARAVNIAKPM